jgi:hypothetical protein
MAYGDDALRQYLFSSQFPSSTEDSLFDPRRPTSSLKELGFEDTKSVPWQVAKSATDKMKEIEAGLAAKAKMEQEQENNMKLKFAEQGVEMTYDENGRMVFHKHTPEVASKIGLQGAQAAQAEAQATKFTAEAGEADEKTEQLIRANKSWDGLFDAGYLPTEDASIFYDIKNSKLIRVPNVSHHHSWRYGLGIGLTPKPPEKTLDRFDTVVAEMLGRTVITDVTDTATTRGVPDILRGGTAESVKTTAKKEDPWARAAASEARALVVQAVYGDADAAARAVAGLRAELEKIRPTIHLKSSPLDLIKTVMPVSGIENIYRVGLVAATEAQVQKGLAAQAGGATTLQDILNEYNAGLPQEGE